MKISEFKKFLTQSPDADLRFELPGGTLIPPHAHITEVGRVEKTFVDCGGTVRRDLHCTLQAWVADDTLHRLKPSQLASILEKATPLLGADDLEVEIEYQDRLISQFPVESARNADGVLYFQLGLKHTDCLAKELCLPDESECCSSSTGCC